MAHDKNLADHERAHNGQPGSKVRHGANASASNLLKRLSPDDKKFADDAAAKYKERNTGPAYSGFNKYVKHHEENDTIGKLQRGEDPFKD